MTSTTQMSTEGLLEFEKAMNDFQEMFPTVRREDIERVLRKNDGDVAATIDDLLLRTSMENCSVSSPPIRPPPARTPEDKRRRSHELSEIYRDGHLTNSQMLRDQASCSRQPASLAHSRRSTSSRSSRMSVDDVCRETAIIRDKMSQNEKRLDSVCDEREARILEDEQIALMLQNREFIGYLKRDPQFLKELFGRDIDRNVHPPPRRNVRQTARNAPAVPNGPMISRNYVPEGPVVEGIVSTQKPGVIATMRTKMTSRKQSFTAPYQDEPSGSQVVTQNKFGDDVPAYPYTVEAPPLQEKAIKEKLKTMSKTSKAKLSSMANLFRRNETRGLDDPLPGY